MYSLELGFDGAVLWRLWADRGGELLYDLEHLERDIEEIMAVARECGLDHRDMHFEICPPEVLYSFGAYGMPTRFGHWSFGKAYQCIKAEYDHNLSRMYEMVINTDPCYAFLLQGNSRTQNRLVTAHVLAHSDFFKHNAYFARTAPRTALDSMAAAAGRPPEKRPPGVHRPVRSPSGLLGAGHPGRCPGRVAVLPAAVGHQVVQ